MLTVITKKKKKKGHSDWVTYGSNGGLHAVGEGGWLGLRGWPRQISPPQLLHFLHCWVPLVPTITTCSAARALYCEGGRAHMLLLLDKGMLTEARQEWLKIWFTPKSNPHVTKFTSNTESLFSQDSFQRC